MLVDLTSFTHKFRTACLPDTWQQIKPCDVLLLRSDAKCGYKYKGKAYSPLYDSVGDLFINSGLVVSSVAAHFAALTGEKAHNSPVSYNRAALVQAIFRRLGTLGMVWANRQRQYLWEKILDKAKPYCVIGNQPNVDLCRAGKNKGVRIYDLQHGVISDEHLWYGEKCRNMPANDLPDGFLCWDESSAEALRKWAPQKDIDVRVVGNPWFLRFLVKDSGDSLVQEALITGQIFSNDKPVILVSLQWGLDLYYNHKGFNGVMVDVLEKTILETADTYNWLLRLHPVQLRGPEKDRVQNYLARTFGHLTSVEWKKCSEIALPIVLQQVDLHITEHSTVVVEAGWMGIYSALLNRHICSGGRLENIYSYERRLGMVDVLKHDKNIIKQWIDDKLKKGKGDSTLQVAGYSLRVFIDEIVRSRGKVHET